MTYRGNTYPGGQMHEWRRRYHPIRDGFVQQYRLQFRFSRDEDFPTYLKNEWRWAYSVLNPPVTWNNIPVARRSIIDVLASQVETKDGRAGIPNSIPAVAVSDRPTDHKAIMGFTGKNLEAAEFLLADSLVDADRDRAANDRKLGEAIFASFLRLRMNPPIGEGFNIDSGEPALAIPRDHCVFREWVSFKFSPLDRRRSDMTAQACPARPVKQPSYPWGNPPKDKQHVTIAAGFVTREGFLICADTQYTGGAKVYKPKVVPLRWTTVRFLYLLCPDTQTMPTWRSRIVLREYTPFPLSSAA